MNSILRIAALRIATLSAAVLAVTLPQAARAQIPAELKNPKISFAYVPPDNAKKEPNAFYNPTNWRIEICYEIIEFVEKLAPQPDAPVDGFTRDEVVVGSFVGVLMHEVGHAAFDMFNVPVFGREEDAADEMAAFIAGQFNKEVAFTVTRGFAYLWRSFGQAGGEPKEWADFAGEHGANQQRYYNVLCMGYGADPALFKDFIDKGWLPKERSARCGAEYQQVRLAFGKTVLPFINQGLIKKVQETNWLK